MKKNFVQNIIIHTADNIDSQSLAYKVSQFHVDLIERRLKQSGLAREQRITVINTIVSSLQSREVNNGIIK